MGLLSTPPSRDDPKRQTGAYLALDGRTLYWVCGSKPGTTLLEVENCATGYRSHLGTLEIMRAELIREAPMLDVPDTIPEQTPEAA